MPSSEQSQVNSPNPQPIPHQGVQRRAQRIRRQIRDGAEATALVKELRSGHVRPEAIATLTYAAWEIEGELVACRRGDRSTPKPRQLQQQLTVIESTLGSLERIDRGAREKQLSRISSVRSAPNHLSAMVMQHLGGPAFQEDLRRILEEDGLGPNAVYPPSDAGPSWAHQAGLLPAPEPHVIPYLRYSDADFVKAMLKDAAYPGSLPDHPLIAERRLALEPEATRQARHRIGHAEQRVSKVPLRQQTPELFKPLHREYRTAGMLALRQRQAQAILADARILVRKVSTSAEFMRLRADYLQRAAEATAQREPALWQTVLGVVVQHQRGCPDVRSSFPCAECAPELAEAIRKGLRPDPVPHAPGNQPEEQPTDSPFETGTEEQGDPSAATEGPVADHEPTEPPPLREDALLVAVSASTSGRSSTVGLAWVTEVGEIGVATDLAGDSTEAGTLALSRAVADLQSTELPLDLITTNDMAVNRARQLLAQRAGEEPSVASDLRDVPALLRYLVGRRGKVRVLSGAVAREHAQLVEAASELARVALASVRGSSTEQDLKRKVQAVATRLAVHEAELLTPPHEYAAEPRVRQVGGRLEWKQPLHTADLDNAALPLPDQVRRALRSSRLDPRLSLTLIHRSPACPGDKRVVRVRQPHPDGDLRLDGSRWPEDFFPGIQVECSWLPDKRSFTIKTLRLPSPLRVNGHSIGYSYDPLVLTRETAPGGSSSDHPVGLSVDNWVLRTMQILGYLDADGRAVLAEEALERNMVELGFPPGQLHQVTGTVKKLLGSQKLERVKGSIGPGGHPIYPPVRHRPAVDLLSFQPSIVKETRQKQGHHLLAPPKRSHYVSGFVRRLPLGQSASDEAIQAHAEAQQRARVANDGPLKQGYTFVRKHRRNGHRD